MSKKESNRAAQIEETFSKLAESLKQSKQLAAEVDMIIESDLQKIINKVNEMASAGKLNGWKSSTQWCG